MANDKSQKVLDRIAASANEEQKQKLVQWADTLLTIRESNASLRKKVVESISATANFSTIKPLFTLIGKELMPREFSALSEELIATYHSSLTPLSKTKKCVSLIGKSLKDLGWDKRGLSGRLGIATAIATLIIFGTQGAGIAALGTAIGVPLWVVFGAGAAFLGDIYERFTGKRRPEASYTIIEGERRRDDA